MASDRASLRNRTAALVFLAVTGAASIAHADPSLSDRETARALMDEGDAKRDKKDLKGALKSYEAADAIMKVPTTGIEVARTQAALGLLLEARETLSRVVRIPGKPGEPPAFATARKAAETLNEELGTRLPSVTVTVVNAEPGATVQITFDGEPVPPAAASAPRKVNPGKHTIVAKAGAQEKSEDVQVAEKEAKLVTVDLAKKAVVAPPPNPEETTPTSSGSGSTWKIVMWTGFGVGVVGVAVGSITGLMSISKENDVEATCKPAPGGGKSCPAGSDSKIDTVKSLGTISTIGFIAGGVGVAVGVVGLVMSGKSSGDATPPSSAATARVRVRPEIGPTWAGVSGTF